MAANKVAQQRVTELFQDMIPVVHAELVRTASAEASAAAKASAAAAAVAQRALITGVDSNVRTMTTPLLPATPVDDSVEVVVR